MKFHFRKGQVSMGDFLIGFMLFFFVIIIISKSLFTHFSYDDYSELQLSAATMSESLISEGFPYNWTNETVVKIGLTTNHRLNLSKLEEYKNISYGSSLSYLGIGNEYFFYFEKGNQTLNISGCGFGNTLFLEGCNVNTRNAEDNLVKIDRFLIYNSSIVKMVVLVW